MTVTIDLTDEQLASLMVSDHQRLYAKSKPIISNDQDVVAYLSHLKDLQQEHSVVITLNSRSRIIRRHVISKGTVDAALVHPRELFRPAILDNAAKVILAHNHPSGDCTPSEDDVTVTRRMVSAGKIMGIAVVDHVIVAAGGHYSMQSHGHI